MWLLTLSAPLTENFTLRDEMLGSAALTILVGSLGHFAGAEVTDVAC
jgi:hypothetical protein